MTTADDHIVPEFALAMRGYDRLQVDDYITRLHAWIAEAEARQGAAETATVEGRQRATWLEQRVRDLESEQRAASPTGARDTAHQQIAAAAAGAVDDLRGLNESFHAKVGAALDAAVRAAGEIAAVARARMVELEAGARADREGASSALEEATASAHAVATEIRQQAIAEAESIVADARAAADTLVTDAEERRDRVLAEADQSRKESHEELNRLHDEHQRALNQLGQLRSSLEALVSAPVAVLAALDGGTNTFPVVTEPPVVPEPPTQPLPPFEQ